MPEEIEVILELDKECKHSNRFGTQNPDSPVTSIYILKGNMPEVKKAKKVKVVLSVVE